jgi:hypothetical protein
MKPTILKHCAGRNYNSPLHQEKKVEANVAVDANQKMLSPSLRASSGALSANAGANISPTSKSYNAGINYNKGGFSVGVNVEKNNKSKPNVTANASYKF